MSAAEMGGKWRLAVTFTPRTRGTTDTACGKPLFNGLRPIMIGSLDGEIGCYRWSVIHGIRGECGIPATLGADLQCGLSNVWNGRYGLGIGIHQIR
jgi:hypothetical protein